MSSGLNLNGLILQKGGMTNPAKDLKFMPEAPVH
jgi:hypothetical protein